MLVLAFAATALTAPAAAPVGASPPPSAELDTPQPHRSGIVLGLPLGAGIGQASGYPNNSQDIGDAQFYSSSGWLPGTSGTFLLMGAIADYLNFGFWFGTSSFRSGEGHARSTGVGLRVEAFPLVTLAPRFSGLGFFSEFGLGSGSLTEPNHPVNIFIVEAGISASFPCRPARTSMRPSGPIRTTSTPQIPSPRMLRIASS